MFLVLLLALLFQLLQLFILKINLMQYQNILKYNIYNIFVKIHISFMNDLEFVLVLIH